MFQVNIFEKANTLSGASNDYRMKMRYRSEDGEKTTATATRARLFNSAVACHRAARTTLRPSYGMGMWRAVALLACLTATTHAALFTEGGAVLNGQDNKANKNVELAHGEKVGNLDDYDFGKGQEEGVDKSSEPKMLEDEYLEYMVREMNQLEETEKKPQPKSSKLTESNPEYAEFLRILDSIPAPKRPEQKVPQPPFEHQPSSAEFEKNKVASEPFDLDDLLRGELLLERKLAREAEYKHFLKVLEETPRAAKANVESLESAMQTATGEPQVPQKKGQNEFVSFVEPEPQPAKQTVSAQSIDKRRLATSAELTGNAPKYSSSSLLLLAVGTVMCVGLLGTAVGGTYYYKNNRRDVTPDDGEYAPYAGTGPGFRKNKGNKGDETLAYKAQLHQYQQAKQKIICGEDAPGIIESDGEDGADEENNYSVYECPGLAPTGDIEVCNPNFAAKP
ncbi:unnamed protein product [Caenorhabditis sp. 36 PRJEB53466]|nr:unnamed protein product [Caenorhabditis sp. 36 PRJEB53466]